jgi:hypothetical protein
MVRGTHPTHYAIFQAVVELSSNESGVKISRTYGFSRKGILNLSRTYGFSRPKRALFCRLKPPVQLDIITSLADAQHIAAASVAEADMVVSWNFRHIVHYEKINGYHAVNLLNGYKPIPIYSPREVVSL